MSLRAVWQALLRPSPAEPPPLIAGGNPGLAWLDAARLPWRAARAELAARFGVHADNPYRWNLVSLDVQPPPLTGLLWPFGFQAFEHYNPAMPPERLSTHVCVGNDAEANLGHAAAQLARVLGPQPVVDRYNTRRVEWRWGSTLVSLIAWPAAMQSGPTLSNPAHDRDPRLHTACSVSVQTGWRPPLSARERALLDGFVPMRPTRNWTPAGPRQDPADRVLSAETLLEFMREPPADAAPARDVRAIGRQGGADRPRRRALRDPAGGCERLRGAADAAGQGRGGSELVVMCDTGHAACPSKSVSVVKGSGADDLNEAAADLAAAAGKPVKLWDYDYDC